MPLTTESKGTKGISKEHAAKGSNNIMDALQAKTIGTEIQTKQEKENDQFDFRFGYCTRPRSMPFCTENTKVNRVKV